MNETEAIEILRYLYNINLNLITNTTTPEQLGKIEDNVEALDLAIKVLEKQIPKEPIKNPWQIAKCPCCGAELGEWLGDGYHKDYENLKVCDCGQKLDWSVTDDR